jgi:hypothetical protein
MATTPGLGRPTVQQTATRAGTGDGPNVKDAERQRYSISAEDLFEAAKRCRDARIRGAILAVAWLDDRMSLTDAARTWRVDVPTLRDVIRRLEDSGVDGLGDLIATSGMDADSQCLGSSNPKTST